MHEDNFCNGYIKWDISCSSYEWTINQTQYVHRIKTPILAACFILTALPAALPFPTGEAATILDDLLQQLTYSNEEEANLKASSFDEGLDMTNKEIQEKTYQVSGYNHSEFNNDWQTLMTHWQDYFALCMHNYLIQCILPFPYHRLKVKILMIPFKARFYMRVTLL